MSSQKKEWILKTLNSKEYQDQQQKVDLILKPAKRYTHEASIEHSDAENDKMEIDGYQVWLSLCKRGIE